MDTVVVMGCDVAMVMVSPSRVFAKLPLPTRFVPLYILYLNDSWFNSVGSVVRVRVILAHTGVAILLFCLMVQKKPKRNLYI